MRVAVIGAGAAGLVTIRELRRAGIGNGDADEVVAFEAGAEVGGTWVYTDDVEGDPLGRDPSGHRVLGSMYASLRTNLPRDLMAFRDYPFDAAHGDGKDARRFPGHGAVLAYLEHFAKDLDREFDALSSIRFETSVTRVTPPDGVGSGEASGGPGTWIVESRGPGDEGGETRETFDAVIVCNGHFSDPFVPELPGMQNFGGTLLHSHSYRHAAPFAGQRVAVLGAGSSGTDLSRELAGVARDVSLCSRDVSTATPVQGHDNLQICPNIAQLEERSLILEDGSRIDEVDTLLFCTGYRYSLPFFSTSTDLVRWSKSSARVFYCGGSTSVAGVII